MSTLRTGSAVALLALSLAACGGLPAHSGPPVGAELEQINARGVPGAGPYRLLIVAASGVDDLGLYGAWYAFVATGWNVRVATLAPTGTLTDRGRPVGGDLQIGGVDPAKFHAVYVPGGLPADPALHGLIARFAAERHLFVGPGAVERVTAAGVSVPAAGDDERVRIDGNRLVTARVGDIPHLVWTAAAYAEDRLRAEVDAAGRDVPP